jgi:leucyl aminopeptidase (aminopeptidase T)
MLANLKSPMWAENIVRTCMAISPGEDVFVLVDQPLAPMHVFLLNEVRRLKPKHLWEFVFPNALRPILEFPSLVHQMGAKADAAIVFFAHVPPEETPGRLAFWRTCHENHTRVGFGAQIDVSILMNELSVDYREVAAITRRLKARLQGRRQVHITTSLGTDLTMSIAGRNVKEDTGLIHEPGQFGNLPAGECFVAPLEDSAKGVLVVDKSFPELLLSQPVRMTFKAGRVIAIEGGPEAEEVERRIAYGEQKEYGENCRVIAELGIGSNPKARLTGKLITDEKVMGTIHIAIGDNSLPTYGGANRAPIHLDGVVGQPTLVVDGETLIDAGSYLV